MVFGGRRLLIALFCLVTLFFAAVIAGALTPLGISGVHFDANQSKLVPSDHPYIQTSSKFATDFGGRDTELIVLEAKTGTIFTKEYFEELQKFSRCPQTGTNSVRATPSQFAPPVLSTGCWRDSVSD